MGLGVAVDSVVQGVRVANSLGRLKLAQTRYNKATMASDALKKAPNDVEIPGELSTSLKTELESATEGLKIAQNRWRNTNAYYNRVTDYTSSGKATTKTATFKSPTDAKKLPEPTKPSDAAATNIEPDPWGGPTDTVSTKESINTKYDAEGSKIVNMTLEDTDLPDEAALSTYKEQQLQKLQKDRIDELMQYKPLLLKQKKLM